MPLIRLIDYLQTLESRKGTGCLRVTRKEGGSGEIFLDQGAIVFASVPDMTCGLHTVAVMSVWEPSRIEWFDAVKPPVNSFRVAVSDVLARIEAPGAQTANGIAHQRGEARQPAEDAGLSHGPLASRRLWCLELLNTPRQGLRLALDKPQVCLGRDHSNDITLLHPSVSRSHCQFVIAGDRVRVLDLGSSNGTLVDGKPVTEALLSSGCEIRLGICQFRLSYAECDVEQTGKPVVLFAGDGTSTDPSLAAIGP